MIHFHCWHEVPDTLRKIRVPSRCRTANPNYQRMGEGYAWNDYVLCKIVMGCCICGKQKIVKVKKGIPDSRLRQVPDILDAPLKIK